MSDLDRLSPSVREALDRYGVEIARHHRESPRVTQVENPYTHGPVQRFEGVCSCGWISQPRRNRGIANRSAGLHVSLAWKAADRQFDREAMLP